MGRRPRKKREPDGTLTPRNSFASYVKNHLKKGKPWCTVDKTMVKRFVDQIEKNSSNEISKEHAETIQALQYERNQAIDDAKVNFDFFAHMAHELRTPFHGILGSLEAMREDPKLADHELLKMAYMCGESMIKILDDILLLAKGSYTMQLEEQSVDIHAFLRQTLADMNSYARMEGQSIRIRKEDTVVTQVAADFSRVRQIINNLISNAIKFSENDIFVEVLQRKSFSDVVSVWKTYTTSYPNVDQSLSDVENLTNDPQGNKSESDDTIWTIFSVVDNGIGISKDDLKLLGTAFTQLSTGRQKRYQGTGLGISICNLLITALRGKLVVFSAPGFGSCFTFAIPVKKDPEPTKPTATKEQKNTIGNTERKLQLKQQFDSLGLQHLGLKILVVDDSKLNRKLCGRKINTWLPDINVTECVSGVEALEEYKYDHGSIFGIFMDFHMPGMDGDRCTREIRAYENTNGDVGHAYIAGFTADVLEDSTKTLIAAGMDSEFQSPSLPMHLKQTCLA